jgi:predicted permease
MVPKILFMEAAMALSNVFNQILVLFFILIIGIIVKRLNVVSENLSKGLTDIILNISLPALIINSMRFNFSPEALLKSGKMLLISTIIQVACMAIAVPVIRLFKIQGPKKNIFQFMLVFSNVGFMGYPVINAIYGAQGIFYTALYNLSFNVLCWTIGIMIISNKKENRMSFKNLINPGIISILIGFAVFVFSIKLPGPVASTLEMLGSLTTPLSMLMIGIILADSSIKQAFSDPMVFIMSAFRLLVIPLLSLVVLKMFLSDSMLLGVSVVMAAMPAAANTAIFASKYGSDSYTASKCIFVSTFLSIATIPLITYLIQIF